MISCRWNSDKARRYKMKRGNSIKSEKNYTIQYMMSANGYYERFTQRVISRDRLLCALKHTIKAALILLLKIY